MNVLYISYWGLNESLTDSTVFPHLKIAGEFERVKKITFVTVERTSDTLRKVNLPKVEHIPLRSSQTGIATFNQILDFIKFPGQLVALCKLKKIDLILAKGVFAGALAHKVSKKCKIPYVTESFEPHANYMIESNEWDRSKLKYKFLKKWEQEQIEQAAHLFTVSDNYKLFLEKTYNRSNVSNIPCCVYLNDFKYSEGDRKTIRQTLEIPETSIVGIYVGKFGGIYYEEEAYQLFREAFDFFPDFRLLILTPNDRQILSTELLKKNVDLQKTNILFVKHEDVPKYLSASDFAFSTIKPAPSRKYCCPVKNGEYWANGLPILLTDGVGDDYQIIEKEDGGALFNLKKGNTKEALIKIKALIQKKDYRINISALAAKYRSFEIVRTIYAKLFNP